MRRSRSALGFRRRTEAACTKGRLRRGGARRSPCDTTRQPTNPMIAAVHANATGAIPRPRPRPGPPRAWPSAIQSARGRRGAGDDKRGPERGHRIEGAETVGQGGHTDGGREDDDRAQVARADAGGEVSGVGAEGDGGEYDRPVAPFAAARPDGVDRQGPLARVPVGRGLAVPGPGRRARPRRRPGSRRSSGGAARGTRRGRERRLLLTVCSILPAAAATTGVAAFHHEVEVARSEETR